MDVGSLGSPDITIEVFEHKRLPVYARKVKHSDNEEQASVGIFFFSCALEAIRHPQCSLITFSFNNLWI